LVLLRLLCFFQCGINMSLSLIIVALIGLCISLYTYSVERKIKTNMNYKPVCDISDRISCTKPMQSAYANMFLVSNALVGVAYYLLVIACTALHAFNLLLVTASAACLFSLGMAYILYVKVEAFCILCTSIYVVNFLILGLIFFNT